MAEAPVKDPASETSKDLPEGDREKFTFFYRSDSPFSQWHPSKFEVEGIEYNCAEQYMMHQKAG